MDARNVEESGKKEVSTNDSLRPKLLLKKRGKKGETPRITNLGRPRDGGIGIAVSQTETAGYQTKR